MCVPTTPNLGNTIGNSYLADFPYFYNYKDTQLCDNKPIQNRTFPSSCETVDDDAAALPYIFDDDSITDDSNYDFHNAAIGYLVNATQVEPTVIPSALPTDKPMTTATNKPSTALTAKPTVAVTAPPSTKIGATEPNSGWVYENTYLSSDCTGPVVRVVGEPIGVCTTPGNNNWGDVWYAQNQSNYATYSCNYDQGLFS